jgi:transcriptional regulator with XRE-family HTH domain
VERASDLVRRVREESGISARALAKRAQVPASTVSRVESGTVDPTVGMLQRLLDAAGYDLGVAASRRRRRGPVLAELSDAWIDTPGEEHPDWTALRAFLDYLMMHPDEVGSAIVRKPAMSGSHVMDSLLAE